MNLRQQVSRWFQKAGGKSSPLPYPLQTIKSGEELISELEGVGFYDVAIEEHRQFVKDKQCSGFDGSEELYAVDHPENEFGDFRSMDRRIWFFDAKTINYNHGIRDFLIDAHDVFVANGLRMEVANAMDERGSQQHHRTTELTINDRRYIIFTDRANSRFESGVRLVQLINEECRYQKSDVRCYTHRESVILVTEQQAAVIKSAYKKPDFGLQDEELFIKENLAEDLPALKIIYQ